MYLTFSIKPYTHKLPRAIQKPMRIYFFDNMDVETPEDKILGARFENLVAAHLLKRIHYIEDYSGHKYSLCYLRDKDQREVDFVIVKDRKVEELIEVKYSDESISTDLSYYTQKLKPKQSTQIVFKCRRSFEKNNIKVMSPMEYFRKGPWQK